MDRIRIGLVGCGKQASKHITSLQKIPALELVLSDIQSSFAQDLGEAIRCDWVKHPDDIFEDASIQAVVISTPTQTHAPLIKKAIDSEKDVFCEKPLSDSIEETNELQEIAEKSDQIVMVGYVYRFVPICEEAYRLFREQAINGTSLIMGKPLSALFRLGGRGGHRIWKHQKATGGGAINEMLVHMIDLANWYFGPLDDIKVVSCDLRYPERLIQGQKTRVDAEDFVFVKCKSANGAEMLFEADLITPAFSQYFEIQAENGSFMGSIQSDMPSYIFLKEDSGGFSSGRTVLNYGRRNVIDTQMMAFVYAILKRQFPDRNSIKDSLELMHIMGEIRKQID